MTEEFHGQALQYLLEELDPLSRQAFETAVARDPVKQEALKSCTDALAHFACDAAPAEPLSAGDQRAALAAILAVTQVGPAAKLPAPAGFAWSRFAWPIAAALLLAVNLLDFRRPLDVPQVSRWWTGASDSEHFSDSPDDSRASGGKAEKTAGSSGGDQGIIPRPPSGEVLREREQLERLRSDYANLQRTSSIVRAEYEALIQHLEQRSLMEKRLGRLAAMELVDERSYASGQRKGLLEIARGLLTEPGIVALDNTTVRPIEPAPSVPIDPGAASGSQVPNNTAPSPPPSTEEAQDPYAWSVFDEAERQGYLNLYNLPEVPSDRSLQLWVRPLDGGDYHRVGEVPRQFYGQSGSLLYTLPENTQTPSEILVTQEPRQSIPVVPTGPVVLRGP